MEAGLANSIEWHGRPLLMAYPFNTTFDLESIRGTFHEDVPTPLRALLKKDGKFHWRTREDDAFRNLLKKVNDRATLQALDV